jgi:iron complex outermembrane receptor protein
VAPDAFDRATEQDSYGVIDIRADWTSFLGSDVDLAAWVKNADDEQYAVGGLEVLQSLGLAAQVYGLPRTWGLSVAYNF